MAVGDLVIVNEGGPVLLVRDGGVLEPGEEAPRHLGRQEPVHKGPTQGTRPAPLQRHPFVREGSKRSRRVDLVHGEVVGDDLRLVRRLHQRPRFGIVVVVVGVAGVERREVKERGGGGGSGTERAAPWRVQSRWSR